MTLDELAAWAPSVPNAVPCELRDMAKTIVGEMAEPIRRLQQLGLGYLSLDRASASLSTGERQRVQLARAVRGRTTGVLYVLDEPSIGLHPSNVDGLLGVVDDLLADGNSVVLVDHDVRVLRHADHIVEIGPESGSNGGRVIAQGSPSEIAQCPESRTGAFLSGERRVRVRARADSSRMFDFGCIELSTGEIHTVKSLSVRIPRGRLVAVTGVSGSGKTTLVLEGLVPALRANAEGAALPKHVKSLNADGIERVHLIDASPIGANVRSTVATYSGVLDDLRRAYAKTPAAQKRGLKMGAFSYNTGSLRCETCDGTGQVSLDVQFLPDVDMPCPSCGGTRYGREAYEVKRGFSRESDDRALADRLSGGLDIRVGGTSDGRTGGAVDARTRGILPESVARDRGVSLPDLLAMTVDEARDCVAGLRSVEAKLDVLHDLGLGYLTLGEATPALSGGEAQRLKLAGELTRNQDNALFVFDEPTIGLHPFDVEVLLGVLQRLVDAGATVVVIEHDLDMIANADYVIDLGPGGGEAGGEVVVCGTPEDVALCERSATGRYIKEELEM